MEGQVGILKINLDGGQSNTYLMSVWRLNAVHLYLTDFDQNKRYVGQLTCTGLQDAAKQLGLPLTMFTDQCRAALSERRGLNSTYVYEMTEASLRMCEIRADNTVVLFEIPIENTVGEHIIGNAPTELDNGTGGGTDNNDNQENAEEPSVAPLSNEANPVEQIQPSVVDGPNILDDIGASTSAYARAYRRYNPLPQLFKSEKSD